MIMKTKITTEWTECPPHFLKMSKQEAAGFAKSFFGSPKWCVEVDSYEIWDARNEALALVQDSNLPSDLKNVLGAKLFISLVGAKWHDRLRNYVKMMDMTQVRQILPS